MAEGGALFKTSSAAQQKQFFKSLSCNIACTASSTAPTADASRPSVCRIQGSSSSEQLTNIIKDGGTPPPQSVIKFFNAEFAKRVCLLDGSLDTSFQACNLTEADYRGEHFSDFNEVDDTGKAIALKGNHDLLVFTKPELVEKIHKDFFEAGSDICKTNTFGGTSIAQADYKIHSIIYELNKTAAQIAKKASSAVTKADTKKPRFVAGALGPTRHSLSTPSNEKFPAYRSICWDELVDSYLEQVAGLVDGGVDLLLIEMASDTLNAKAAIYAIDEYFERKKKERLPLLIETTVTTADGRNLSGQSMEAFFVSIKHANALSVGIKGSVDAKLMKDFYAPLASLASCWCHMCPDASDPEAFASGLQGCAKDGLLNLAGGCSGTTPAHIAAALKKLKDCTPRTLPALPALSCMQLSSTEACFIQPENGAQLVGQRCNPIASAAFKGSIDQCSWDEALAIAAAQADKKADVLDINVDSSEIDSVWGMGKFVRTCSSVPKIAKLPLMIESSEWCIMEEGLKNSQGKCIVNALNINRGRDEFLWMAKMCRRFGAAILVSTEDDKNSAQSSAEKVRTCQECYKILRTQLDFPAEDIIFDPSLLGVGTKLSSSNAINFINALAEIKRTCPGVSLCAGVSNVSILFGGSPTLRQAMHSVFLYHAIQNGLNFAIVDPGKLLCYEDIESETRTLCEEIILDKSADGNHQERFIAFASYAGALNLVEVSDEKPLTMQPKLSATPIRAMVQAVGTINSSIFQQFGSKAHASFNIFKYQQAMDVSRSIMFSSISAWMGQGGSPIGPPASSMLDEFAWWSRAQSLTNNAISMQWGPVGDIGLRRAVYGSRDAFATGQLGQKLIMPEETRYILKVAVTFQNIPEFLGLGFLDEATRMDLQRGGDFIIWDTHPEIKVR